MIRWPFKKQAQKDPIEEKDRAFRAAEITRQQAAKELQDMDARLRELLQETVRKAQSDGR